MPRPKPTLSTLSPSGSFRCSAHICRTLSRTLYWRPSTDRPRPRGRTKSGTLTDLALPPHHHADLLVSGGQEAYFLPLRVFCVPQTRLEERVRRSERGGVLCFQDERIVATEARSSRRKQLQQQLYFGVSAPRNSTAGRW